MPYIVPVVLIRNFWTALAAAPLIFFFNAFILPIPVFLTLPLNFLTLGLFTLVINAILFWFASTIVKGFEVSGFTAAFLGALAYWLIAWLGNVVAGTK